MPMLLACLALVVFAAMPAIAQNAPPTKVLAIGGLLGQMDGFCQDPGGTYDLKALPSGKFLPCAEATGLIRPTLGPNDKFTLGGLLGAEEWVRKHRPEPARDTVVALSGNNQVANFTFLGNRIISLPPNKYTEPAGTVDVTAAPELQTEQRFLRFWQGINALHADAIGLAAEDFVRSLRNPLNAVVTTKTARAYIFQQWMERITNFGSTTSGIPLLGSNVVIRSQNRHAGHLNTVEDGAFKLSGIDEDQSAGWLTEVKVAHPGKSGLSLSLIEVGPTGGAKGSKPIAVATPASTRTSTSLTPEEGALRPGYVYQVKATVGGRLTAELEFQTHGAFTPRQNTGKFADLPIVVKEWQDSPMLIVSLVDPGIKTLLGAEALKWTTANGSLCPVDECHIDFMSPVDAMAAIMSRAYPEDDAGQKPFVLLISSLPDDQTQKVLEAFPEIRIVVLPQESMMLGRTSRAYQIPADMSELETRLAKRNPERNFSGDQGLFAVTNHERPAGTSIFVRPEWLGEVAETVRATVTYTASQEWNVTDEVVNSELVRGATLTWRDSATPSCPDCTTFSMQWPDLDQKSSIPYGRFQSYLVCDDSVSDRCDKFVELLEVAQFNMFAGDTLRRATGSELAFVPGTLLDDDEHQDFIRVFDRTHTRALTRFMLERIIQRSFLMVRATVAGADLVATLGKALKSSNHGGSCIVGVGDTCATSVDPNIDDKLLINGRPIDPRLYYSIAMPEGLAEELALSHARGGHAVDAVSALDNRLMANAKDSWYIPPGGGLPLSLAARIALRANETNQHDVTASSIEFGYTKSTLTSPDDDLLEILDVGFRGITRNSTLTAKADIDFAVIDVPWVALRAVSTLDFNRRTDVKSTGNQITYPNNNWMLGLRYDARQQFRGREVRPYVGYFFERELEAPQKYLSAQITLSEKGLPFTTKQTFNIPVKLTQPPLQFRYAAAGVDVLNPKKFWRKSWLPLDVTKAGLQFAGGELLNAPIGATINGEQTLFGTERNGGKPLNTFSAILNDYYARTADDFNVQSFEAYAVPRPQRRLQAELNFELHPKVFSKTWKLGFELRHRHYAYDPPDHPGANDDFLNNYLRTRVKWSVPIGRAELGPMWEYHIASIMQDDVGYFQHHKIEVTLKFPFVLRSPGWGWLWQ